MTRGKIIIIKNGTIFSSIEFNGDMYPSGNGKLAIHLLFDLHDSKELEVDFENKINAFNKNHYGYEDYMTVHRLASVSNEHFHDLLNMKQDYINNWFSDYLYIRNFDDEEYCMHTRDVSVNLKKDTIYVLYFGKLRQTIEVSSQK